MWKLCGTVFIVIFAISFSPVFGFPYDELMQEQNDDTALVESTIRETRAVRPQSIHDLLSPGVKEAYIHKYGDEPDSDGNVQGFSKKINDKGDDGYKHFDSYHKKNADKYGFEVHSEFGKLDKANVDTDKKKHEEKEEINEEDDGEASKKAYKVVEDPEGGNSYFGHDESGDSENYADGESEAESEDEESSPYSNNSEDGDAENENYEEEEKSSYSDDGDEESEGYNEESEED